jgi:hypothetical protein
MRDDWTSQLIGQTVEAVEQWEGCPCVITLTGGYRINVESLWRLLSSGVLELTSEDEGQLFGRDTAVHAMDVLSDKLPGCSLAAVDVAEGTADLSLHFGKLSFQVISNSSGYEAWQIEGPAGIIAVGQGGGAVAVWD